MFAEENEQPPPNACASAEIMQTTAWYLNTE